MLQIYLQSTAASAPYIKLKKNKTTSTVAPAFRNLDHIKLIFKLAATTEAAV